VSGIKPFLKWAGGKRQLLPHLRPYYPARFGTYIEPFVGSAAVFFDLHNLGHLDEHDVRLADSSVDLIDCYTAVRDDVE
jgi:DNA adenine methylase